MNKLFKFSTMSLTALFCTFFLLSHSKAECVPYLNHDLVFDPIGIVANGTAWFGYIQKINNKAFLYDSAGKYLGEYAANTYATFGDCTNSYTIQYKVTVPGDDGATYVEINKLNYYGDWYTRVLWAQKIYRRSSIQNVLD